MGKKNGNNGEAKPKKPKKEKDPNAKPRKKQAWKLKQMTRLETALKRVEKLASVFSTAKAPNITVLNVGTARDSLTAFKGQLEALPDDWKPEKGSSPGTSKKLGINSVIAVKADLNRDEVKMFKHISADLFTGATIVDDDNRNWIVQCSDGVKRTVGKKMVARYVPPAPKESASNHTAHPGA